MAETAREEAMMEEEMMEEKASSSRSQLLLRLPPPPRRNRPPRRTTALGEPAALACIHLDVADRLDVCRSHCRVCSQVSRLALLLLRRRRGWWWRWIEQRRREPRGFHCRKSRLPPTSARFHTEVRHIETAGVDQQLNVNSMRRGRFDLLERRTTCFVEGLLVCVGFRNLSSLVAYLQRRFPVNARWPRWSTPSR
jgi:hypothetical protein